MLVFIDESGDTGLKVAEGSSAYFVVGLITFEDHDEATACDQRIELLKREAFFDAMAPYGFFYFGIAIQKAKLYGKGFQFKEPFYNYRVIANNKPFPDGVPA